MRQLIPSHRPDVALLEGYVWVATIQLAPLFWVKGWDSYVNGSGKTP